MKLHGLFGREQGPQHVDLLGHPFADETEHAGGPAPARGDSQIHLGYALLFTLGGNDEVAGHGDLQTSANRISIHGRDGHLVEFFKGPGHFFRFRVFENATRELSSILLTFEPLAGNIP